MRDPTRAVRPAAKGPFSVLAAVLIVVLVAVPTGSYAAPASVHAAPTEVGRLAPEGPARAVPPSAARIGLPVHALALPSGIHPSVATPPHLGPGATLPAGHLTPGERARIPNLLSLGTVPAIVRASNGPPDLNLTNTTTMVISVDTTVGNITLSGNATLYVHSATVRPTLTVLGNIRLSGRSTLFINDSVLAIGESYDVQWTIQVTGDSRFVTDYSNVTTHGYQWGAAFENSANVTILNSLVGYPSGWLDTDLVGSPTLVVAYSWYSSDVILFDNALAPSTANFTAGDSAGFNIWLNFKAGTAANLSLPGLEGWRNWTYPGAAHESGTGYTVTVINSFVQVFAIMLWQGASLTLVDSPDVVVALNIEYGPVALSGLRQAHYPDLPLSAGGFDLQLWNTTIFTWNVYPFAGAVSITSSQVGEIQVFGTASANVTASNLTGQGGYYGNQGTAFLSITDSTIAGQVVAYEGRVDLVNSTVNTSYSSRVLATGTGIVYGLNCAIGPLDTFQVLGAGTIVRAGTVNVTVDQLGTPQPGTALAFDYAVNGTQAGSASTDAGGRWSGPVNGWTLGPDGAVEWNYTIRATSGASVGLAPLAHPTMPATVSLPVVPIVAGSSPIGGATGLPENLSAVNITFAFPMVAATTQSAVTAVPALAWTPLWDATDQVLSLQLTTPLVPNTTYTFTVGTGATTQNGLSPAALSTVSFSTGAIVRPVPSILQTLPADGAVNVSRSAAVLVTFSVPMNLTELEASFSIGPASPAGTFSNVSATLLEWQPTGLLAANTSFTVVISTAAKSVQGLGLAQDYTFGFRTLGGSNSTVPIHGPPPLPSSAPGVPWPLYAGLVLLAFVVGLAALLLMRRRRGPPPAATLPPAAATPPVAPAPWSEDLTPPSGSR